jgi:drug/metabolite transporter (DMT)-like permease
MRAHFEANPLLGAITGAMCIAFSGPLVRLADVSPTTAALFRCGYALPVLGAVAAIEQRRHGPRPRRTRWLAAAAGVFFAADLVLWHHTIAVVGAGLATVLGNLQVVVVALLAWLVLGERLPRRLVVAIPVVLGGVVLISGLLGTPAYGDDPALGVLFGGLTSLAYGGFILVLRQGAADRVRPAGPLFDATAVAVVTLLAYGLLARDVDLVPAWPAHGWLVTLALTAQVAGWLLISLSLPRIPAAATSLVLLLQPAGALGLGALLLAERPTAGQLAGVLLILAGVVYGSTRRTPATAATVAATGPPVTVEDAFTRG